MSSLLVQKDTVSRSKEPTVITTASGKAEPTEESDSVRIRSGRLCDYDVVGIFTNSAGVY